MKKEIFVAINNYMLKMTDGFIHDKTHIYRVTNQALNIAKSYENANIDIIIASCLLHDIGRYEQYKDNLLCHSEKGAELAYDFLLRLGWQISECEHVKNCIETHSFKKKLHPKSIEAKILFDADKLDMIGALGISRVLLFKGYMKLPLYISDIVDKKDYSNGSFLREYEERLLKVYDCFYTEQAKKIAKERMRLTNLFYHELLEGKTLSNLDYLVDSIIEDGNLL